jgi:hypothetical protein
MNAQWTLVTAALVCCGILVSLGPSLGQEKEKDKAKTSIQSLFAGLPADLQKKVKHNPVRCDRVNDWLVENINGKGKVIEMKVSVEKVRPIRNKDGSYYIELKLVYPTIELLGDEWSVYLSDRPHPRSAFPINFVFDAVSAKDAERLADSSEVVVHGTVREVTLPRFSAKPASLGSISIALTDAQIDGQKWKKGTEKKGGGFEK